MQMGMRGGLRVGLRGCLCGCICLTPRHFSQARQIQPCQPVPRALRHRLCKALRQRPNARQRQAPQQCIASGRVLPGSQLQGLQLHQQRRVQPVGLPRGIAGLPQQAALGVAARQVQPECRSRRKTAHVLPQRGYITVALVQGHNTDWVTAVSISNWAYKPWL